MQWHGIVNLDAVACFMQKRVMPDLPDSKIAAWVELVRTQRTALTKVERALKDAGFPSIEWYDVLLELVRGGPLRPRDLQERLLFAQYNLSRLLDRMEKAELIERTPCPDDARCQWIKASKHGIELRKQMWPIYSNAVNQLFDRLSDAEADRLASLLQRTRDGSA